MSTAKSNRSGSRRSTALLLALAMALAAVPCAAAPHGQTLSSSWTLSWESTVSAWLGAASDQLSTLWEQVRVGIDPNGRYAPVPVDGTGSSTDPSTDLVSTSDPSATY